MVARDVEHKAAVLARARTQQAKKEALAALQGLQLQRRKEGREARERLLLLCHPVETLPHLRLCPSQLPLVLPPCGILLFTVAAVDQKSRLCDPRSGALWELRKWTLSRHGVCGRLLDCRRQCRQQQEAAARKRRQAFDRPVCPRSRRWCVLAARGCLLHCICHHV